MLEYLPYILISLFQLGIASVFGILTTVAYRNRDWFSVILTSAMSLIAVYVALAPFIAK